MIQIIKIIGEVVDLLSGELGAGLVLSNGKSEYTVMVTPEDAQAAMQLVLDVQSAQPEQPSAAVLRQTIPKDSQGAVTGHPLQNPFGIVAEEEGEHESGSDYEDESTGTASV
jgi:hypothetical protein